MSSSSPEGRTVPSGGRKFIYASLLILLLAGIGIYFRLNPKLTTLAAPRSTPAQADIAHTAPLSTGEIQETLRVTGTVTAEKFQMIVAPQLVGLRGASAVGNVSTTTTPSSTPTFVPQNSSSLGASNRF